MLGLNGEDVHKKGRFSVHVMQMRTGKRICECMRNAWGKRWLAQDCLGRNAEILPMSAAMWVRQAPSGYMTELDSAL